MTREEQIQQASIVYCDGKTSVDARVRTAFVVGALWSDDYPSEEICRLKFKLTSDVFDTYKRGRNDAVNNPTGGELLHVLNKGRKIGYKEATERAVEFIYAQQLAVPNIEELINELKKHMEQQ